MQNVNHMKARAYEKIKVHYEECLRQHGPTYKGMDWPVAEDVEKRFKVMLAMLDQDRNAPVSLLDLGCGVGFLIDHLQAHCPASGIEYFGIDISSKMIEQARKRHSSFRFECRDVLHNPLPEKSVDYIVMNGLLTEKLTLSYPVMEKFAVEMIKAAYSACTKGIAFNVMSSNVDWCRLDLFHWPLDRAAALLSRECTRNLVIRMDYSLYEYTVYAFREPTI